MKFLKLYGLFLVLGMIFTHIASGDDVSGGYFEQEVYCPAATNPVERGNYYSKLDVLSPRQEQPKEEDQWDGGGQNAIQ